MNCGEAHVTSTLSYGDGSMNFSSPPPVVILLGSTPLGVLIVIILLMLVCEWSGFQVHLKRTVPQN